MLRTKRNYQFDSLPEIKDKQSRININDRLSFRVLSNDGFALIDVVGGVGKTVKDTRIEAEVEFDGTIKLPLIGRVPILGLTHREAEKKIEELFKDHLKDPFVILEITNHRVIVFPGMNIAGGMDNRMMGGARGSARVVELKNNNTSLFEVLAESGGIMGKSWKIKLIRNKYDDKPLVYLFDLSKIEGLRYAGFIVQSGDIIYVDPIERPISVILREIVPYLTLVSTTISIYFTIQTIRELAKE
jgi:polysaccharide export outer membrane protein